MKVRASPAARHDLKEIVDFIARENPQAARRVRRAIRRRLDSLAEQADRGTIVAEDEGLALRRLIEGPFLIFYLAHAGTVLITRIMRGSRDIEAELRINPGWSEWPSDGAP